MKTFYKCIPCFIEQIINLKLITNLNDELFKTVMQKTLTELSQIDYTKPPAYIGGIIYKIFESNTGIKDPFRYIKEQNINIALNLYTPLKEKLNKIKNIEEKLYIAAKISAAGNIIDYGIISNYNNIENLDQTINNIFNIEFKIDHFKKFFKKLNTSNTILFIGDNAGETVFDRIFIEVIKEYNSKIKIYYSTREKPVINDATIEDAIKSGLNKVSVVISQGVDTPGAILDKTSPDFKKILFSSNIVISKGQGNFEALSDINRDVFFLLTVKCDVISKFLKIEKGSIIFVLKN